MYSRGAHWRKYRSYYVLRLITQSLETVSR
jgi:hypothetical protein